MFCLTRCDFLWWSKRPCDGSGVKHINFDVPKELRGKWATVNGAMAEEARVFLDLSYFHNGETASTATSFACTLAELKHGDMIHQLTLEPRDRLVKSFDSLGKIHLDLLWNLALGQIVKTLMTELHHWAPRQPCQLYSGRKIKSFLNQYMEYLI